MYRNRVLLTTPTQFGRRSRATAAIYQRRLLTAETPFFSVNGTPPAQSQRCFQISGPSMQIVSRRVCSTRGVNCRPVSTVWNRSRVPSGAMTPTRAQNFCFASETGISI